MALDIRIVPLGEKHDRAAFSCGEESIDRYLRNTALSAQERNLARTKVAVASHEATRILGYYTLVYHEYRDGELPSKVERRLKIAKLRRVPMLLLAQLGVHGDVQGQGLSKVLLQHAFRAAAAALSEVGVVGIVTDPIDARAEALYVKYGFTRLQADKPRLILPISTLSTAFAG